MRFSLGSAVLIPAVMVAISPGQASAQRRDDAAAPAYPATEARRGDPRPQNLPVARRQDRTGPAVGPGTIGPIGPIGPEIESDVFPALDFTITGYTTTQVGLRWWYTRGALTRVFRSISGGPWSPIQVFGPLPPNSYVDFRDQSARINAENCYRISVSDGVNPYSSQTTPMRCAITRDGREIPVRRVKLRLHIATAANAGTDEPVEVRLQSPSWLVPTVTNWRPAGNSSWLDSTADDFERGSSLTYELMLANLSELSDITSITLAKPGSDDMCVAGIELWVNDQPAFSRNYGQGANSCQLVGGDRVLGIPFEELRSHPAWNLVGENLISGYRPEELRSTIMAQFGHSLHGKGELRNGSELTTTYVDRSRLSVRVPIRIHDGWILGEVDSDVHFDLVLATVAGRTRLTVENIDADSTDFLTAFLPIIGWVILGEVSNTIEASLADIRPIDPGSGFGDFQTCFKPDGGIGVCPVP